MRIIEKSIPNANVTFTHLPIEACAFFDIETTGFVADKSFLYLIGCCYYKNNSWQLIQWFCDSPQEEKEVLEAFVSFLKEFRVILHFNGTTFDIPYITRKCKLHSIKFAFEDLKSIDIYKLVTPFKQILQLESCKQKAIEEFLGLHREDLYSGGELIEVYSSYVGALQFEKVASHKPAKDIPKSTELLETLLLHNEEDLLGLIFISSFLNLSLFFNGEFTLSHIEYYNQTLQFQLETSYPLPNLSLDIKTSDYHLKQNDSKLLIEVKTITETLKFFFSNYKDYYYLPLEDTAIHKSLGDYVDKDFRQKAKANNCYIKKEGTFFIQYDTSLEPYFKREYQDKYTFIELTDELLDQSDRFYPYVCHILKYLLKNGTKYSK